MVRWVDGVTLGREWALLIRIRKADLRGGVMLVPGSDALKKESNVFLGRMVLETDLVLYEEPFAKRLGRKPGKER